MHIIAQYAHERMPLASYTRCTRHECLRQVPMVQRDVRLYAGREQCVEKTLVEGKALCVGLARALGIDAWPRN